MQLKSELPEGWISTTLDSITHEIVRGPFGSALKKSFFVPSGYKVYEQKNVIYQDFSLGNYYVDEAKFQELKRFKINPKDIVISCSGTVGKIAIVPDKIEPGIINQALLKLSIDENTLFLPYFLKLFEFKVQRIVAENTRGSAMVNLSSVKDLKTVLFEIPPLPEQHRIVLAIEALLARLDATNEKLDRVQEILKKFRESVLAAACDGRLTKDWRAENPDIEDAFELLNQITNERNLRFSQKETSIKKSITLERHKKSNDEPFEIPEKWIWIIWNDIVDWITYGFTRPMPHVEEGIPIITAKNVQNSYIDYSIYDMTTEEAFSELSDKDKPKLNEILIVKDGATIGRAAIVDTKSIFCINQSVALLRFGGMTAYIPFLLKVIQSKFTQDLIWANAKGSAMPHISITKFGKLPLPLPPLPEQQEIVRRVDALFTFADSIEAKVAAAREKTEKLRQSILSKAFSGELVETEAEIARRESREYETAEVLLERIKEERGKGRKKL